MTFQPNLALPEALTTHLQSFLEQRPDWSQERILLMSLSLFLLQNGIQDTSISQLYLQSMFPSADLMTDKTLAKGGMQ